MNDEDEKESQSSIRPGDDSDLKEELESLGYILGRNPVFALEMIQTTYRRWWLILLGIVSQSSIRPGDDSDKGRLP